MAGNLFLNIDFGLNPSVDAGVRPYTGTQPLWVNTSIFLSGALSQTQTRVGDPTTVKIRVSNRGQVPIQDARVDAYVMNPFVGATAPAQAIVSLQSPLATITPGSGAPSENDPHVLEAKVAGPNGPQPWIPTAQQLQDSQGHLCLIANCYADDDGAPLPSGQPFAIDTDQHQGQRNISLLAAPSFRENMLTFQVMPAPRPETTTVVELVPLPANLFETRDLGLLASHPAVTVTRGWRYPRCCRKKLAVKGPDGKLHPIRLARRPLPGTLAVQGAEPGTAVKLPPFEEPLRAEIQVDKPIENAPGTLHAVDITQRDESGNLLGGLRILALTTA